MHHRYQRHLRQNCCRYQRHRRQIFPPISLVLLIPVANLPPVSTIPMCTISGCSHLKLNLKAKIYIYVKSTTQRCPNKIIKIFQFEDFCHLPPVSATPLVHLELRISPRIFEKIRNSSIGIIRHLGETDSWKKTEVENLVALSLYRGIATRNSRVKSVASV